jgi:hypothetical protein
VLALLNLASVEPVRKELRDARGFQHVAWLMQAVTPNTKAPEVLLEVRARVTPAPMVGCNLWPWSPPSNPNIA